MLKSVTEVSKHHLDPLHRWLNEKATIQFVGDNVSKKKSTRDTRSDNQAKLHHMYSMIAIKARVTPPPMIPDFSPVSLDSVPVSNFLPSTEDITVLRTNLVSLVSRILCQYIKLFSSLSHLLPKHIHHTYTNEMSTKSDTVVLDVQHKNETKHDDMLAIMKSQQSYLGDNFSGTVLSGGDQLTVERQRNAKRHIMDSDTAAERFECFEPKIEDWHALQTFLMVGTVHVHGSF